MVPIAPPFSSDELVLHNMRTLSSLKPSQKLVVDGNRLDIDERVWLVWTRRRYWRDSWHKAIEPIEFTFKGASKKAFHLWPTAVEGVVILSKSYNGEAKKAFEAVAENYRESPQQAVVAKPVKSQQQPELTKLRVTLADLVSVKLKPTPPKEVVAKKNILLPLSVRENDCFRASLALFRKKISEDF